MYIIQFIVCSSLLTSFFYHIHQKLKTHSCDDINLTKMIHLTLNSTLDENNKNSNLLNQFNLECGQRIVSKDRNTLVIQSIYKQKSNLKYTSKINGNIRNEK